jgi:hypothetical protein
MLELKEEVIEEEFGSWLEIPMGSFLPNHRKSQRLSKQVLQGKANLHTGDLIHSQCTAVSGGSCQ